MEFEVLTNLPDRRSKGSQSIHLYTFCRSRARLWRQSERGARAHYNDQTMAREKRSSEGKEERHCKARGKERQENGMQSGERARQQKPRAAGHRIERSLMGCLAHEPLVLSCPTLCLNTIPQHNEASLPHTTMTHHWLCPVQRLLPCTCKVCNKALRSFAFDHLNQIAVCPLGCIQSKEVRREDVVLR